MTTNRHPLKADAALLALTALWGITFVTVKSALAHSDPFTFLALRFVVGAFALTLVVRGRVFNRPALRRGVVLGIALFLGFVCQTTGLALTTPSRSAFITGLSVVLVPLISLVLFRRWPRWPSVLGIVCSVVGLYVLTQTKAREGASTSLGDLLTLGCAVAFALHIALTERLSRGVPALPMVTVQLWTVAILALACLPFVSRSVEFTGRFVLAVAICGVLASAVAIGVQTWAQARTTAVRAALIFALEPVFAAGCSAAVGAEQLGRLEILGGGLIVLGVLVAELGGPLWAMARERASSVRQTVR